MGDIVLIDTQKEPELGDIVQYNWVINKSNCMGMGPSLYLAKIIGLPGDDVSFQQSSYEANGYEGSLERCFRGANGEIQVIWGIEKLDNIAGMKLKVPNGEYLADKWIGLECPPGEIDETQSSKAYNRFTVKKEAIAGIISEKLGHDKESEKRQKQKVY